MSELSPGPERAPQGIAAIAGLAVDQKMVAWLELFYDLVFAAATLILSFAASKAHGASMTLFWLAMTFAALWWIWLSTAMFANRYRVYDLPQRILIVLQMLFVAVVAIEAQAGVIRDDRSLATAFGILLASIAFMYFRERGRPDPSGSFARKMALTYGVGAVLFLLDSRLPRAVRGWLGLLFLVVAVVPVIIRVARQRGVPPIDEEHLVERMGAFTIIVLGETFVKVAIAVSVHRVTYLDLGTLFIQVVMTFAIFATYFEDIPHAGLQPRRLGVWASLHLVMQIALVSMAIGVSKLIELRPPDHLTDIETTEIIVSLTIIYLALIGISWATRRRPIGQLNALRLATAWVIGTIGAVTWFFTSVYLDETLPFIMAAMIATALISRRVLKSTLVEPSQDFAATA